MTLFSAASFWSQPSLRLALAVSFALPQAIAFAQPANTPTHSGLPEETLVGFVTQIGDGLAAKVQNSTCPEAVVLLDKIKEASSKAPDQDSLVGKVLLDVKTNPKLKDIIIQKVSAPLLNKLLECNMVPLDLVGPS